MTNFLSHQSLPRMQLSICNFIDVNVVLHIRLANALREKNEVWNNFHLLRLGSL